MLALLRKRRSIRTYSDKPVPNETIEKLREAAVRSPSSRNLNPWRFLFITDSSKLEKLSESKEHGAAFLAHASLGIVVCGNSEESDAWVEDCSIASIILQLTAQSLGLGSCWIQIRNRRHKSGIASGEYIRDLLDLPEQLKVESIISAGYPGEEKEGVPAGSLEFDKIIR